MSNPYLPAHELAALVALVASVKPKVMIEFGCNAGLTAKTILGAVPSLERYIGIDVPFDHKTTLTCQQSEVTSIPGHCAANDPRFWLLLQDSKTISPFELEPCDAVFIDGDHSREAVTHDSMLARALIRPGGLIAWHDYQNPAVEVTGALNELRDAGWPIVHVENTWLAFRRIGGSHATSETA